jgi:hypothetical protein
LYGYQWGQQVHAKIVAYNVYGDSADSDISNPTTLMTNPDAPVSLAENTSLRSFFDIAFVWNDGPSNMGSVIIDYELSIADGIEADATFSVFESNIVGRAYTAAGLTSGNMYQFKVKSRNQFGLSLQYSNTITLLCAYVPTAPLAPTTLVIDDYVEFDWQAPYNGGSPITGYKIFTR